MSPESFFRRCASAQDSDCECPALEGLCWLEVSEGGLIARHGPSGAAFLGYAAGELAGRAFRDLFAAEELRGELPEAQSVLAANQREYRACARLRRKNGGLVPVALLYKRACGKTSACEAKPFGCPLRVVVAALPPASEVERLWGGCQNRVEAVAQERHRMLYAIDRQLCAPLTTMALSVDLLRNGNKLMSTSERIVEIRRIEEGIVACRQILEHALAASQSVLGGPTPSAVSVETPVVLRTLPSVV